MRWRRWSVCVIAAWLCGGAAAGWLATSPRTRGVVTHDRIAGRATEDVSVTAADGVQTRGWLVRARTDSRRCVVLAAGIGGNRIAMVERAAWYLTQDCSALLIDLRGTGRSAAEPISLGYHEATDLLAWQGFLRAHGFAQVGVHGQSLGAAAAAYSAERASHGGGWDFAVLESCYDNAHNALRHRLPWVPFPGVTLWPMICCGELRIGVSLAQLDPQRAVTALRAPTVMACGDADASVGRANAAALFAACGAERKSMVWLDGLGHVDLWPDGAPLREAITALLAGL